MNIKKYKSKKKKCPKGKKISHKTGKCVKTTYSKKTCRRKGKKSKKCKRKKYKYTKLNRENLNNESNYENAKPRPEHVCDGVIYPKSVKAKKTRIFAIIGHSSFCAYKDLLRIKENNEPEGFRVDLKKYKDFPNLRYIPVQNIGKKSSSMRMEHFIKQLKTDEKIHSGLIQLDDIKSTKNFSKFVECEFFKENKEDYNFIKKNLKGKEPTLNFNVYPKKDRYGTQNPINTTYEFVTHEPNISFTGIYELTEYKNDSNNSNNNNVNSVQEYINSQVPSNNTNYVENTVANNNNSNNSFSFSLDIHYDDILFNPNIKYDFFKQRERELQVLKAQTKIIKTKENLSKSIYDPTYISKRNLYYTELAALRGSLMIPNPNTKTKLMSRSDYSEDDFNEFTRLNKKLYKLIERREEFEVSLDDIISIILNDNYMKSDDDFIILDFGCKHIIDLPYSNNGWDRPTNSNTRESTVKLDNTLKKEIGPVLEKGVYPYILTKLLEEAKN